MVIDIDRRRLIETLRVRNEADGLLQRLLSDRQASEQRLAEAGKRDLIKSVTGASSLERAIQQTREMILNMDDLLAQMNLELGRGMDHELDEAALASPIETELEAVQVS